MTAFPLTGAPRGLISRSRGMAAAFASQPYRCSDGAGQEIFRGEARIRRKRKRPWREPGPWISFAGRSLLRTPDFRLGRTGDQGAAGDREAGGRNRDGLAAGAQGDLSLAVGLLGDVEILPTSAPVASVTVAPVFRSASV